VSGLVFMVCVPGHVFDSTEGVGSCFHVLRAWTRNRVHQLSFSCFAFSDSFLVVRRVPGPVFMFYAPGVVSRGTEGVGSHFHLTPRARFRWHGGRRVPFSCFALPDSFSAMPSTSGHIFKFCAPELIFDGPEGDGYRFHVLRAGTSFRRYRGCLVLFSCFACPDSFSAVPRVSGSVFMFYAPGVISRGSEGVGSRFHVLHSWTHFRRTKGVGSNFLVLRP
jgi:hypothetical protein